MPKKEIQNLTLIECENKQNIFFFNFEKLAITEKD